MAHTLRIASARRITAVVYVSLPRMRDLQTAAVQLVVLTCSR